MITGKVNWCTREPVCRFRNKHVPLIVTCSPGRGISQQILMECLKKMDELEIFDRSVARPCVLLNFHGSRFGIDFLARVNAEETRWHILTGVPCGAEKWQAGDSR